MDPKDKGATATLEQIQSDVTKIGTTTADAITKEREERAKLETEFAEFKAKHTQRTGLPYSQGEGKDRKFQWRKALQARYLQQFGNAGEGVWTKKRSELERDVLQEGERQFKHLRTMGGEEADAGERGMVTTTDSSGGFLVPDEIGGYSEILRARTPLGKLGWEIIQTRAQPYRWNRMSTGATMTAVAEGATLTESTLAFQQLQYWPKKFGTYVVVSSEALREADPSIEAIVNNELLARAGINAVTMYLIGTGASGQPYGITVAPGISAYSTNVDPLTFGGLMGMIETLKTSNVLMDGSRLGWVMHPFSESAIMSLNQSGTGSPLLFMGTPANSQYGYANEGLTIWGIPYGTTTILGGTEGASDLILHDFSQSALLRWGALEVAMSPHPLFTSDNTVIRVTDRINVLLKQPSSVVFATTVGKA